MTTLFRLLHESFGLDPFFKKGISGLRKVGLGQFKEKKEWYQFCCKMSVGFIINWSHLKQTKPEVMILGLFKYGLPLKTTKNMTIGHINAVGRFWKKGCQWSLSDICQPQYHGLALCQMSFMRRYKLQNKQVMNLSRTDVKRIEYLVDGGQLTPEGLRQMVNQKAKIAA